MHERCTQERLVPTCALQSQSQFTRNLFLGALAGRWLHRGYIERAFATLSCVPRCLAEDVAATQCMKSRGCAAIFVYSIRSEPQGARPVQRLPGRL